MYEKTVVMCFVCVKNRTTSQQEIIGKCLEIEEGVHAKPNEIQFFFLFWVNCFLLS
jgi:hypothetical protein